MVSKWFISPTLGTTVGERIKVEDSIGSFAWNWGWQSLVLKWLLYGVTCMKSVILNRNDSHLSMNHTRKQLSGIVLKLPRFLWEFYKPTTIRIHENEPGNITIRSHLARSLRTVGAEVRNIVMNGEGKGTRLEVRFSSKKWLLYRDR